MGAYASKLFSHHGDCDGKSKSSSPNSSRSMEKHQCTPIMTRKSADPRSVTVGITRTPIEVSATPTGPSRRAATAIPKYLQTKQYLETDIDAVTTTMTPERQIPDPRSPNSTQERTPIVVKSVGHYVSPLGCVKEPPEIKTPECLTGGLDPRSPATNFDRTPILKPKTPDHFKSNSADHQVTSNLQSENLRMSYCETTTDYSIPEVHALSEILAKPSNLNKLFEDCDTTKNDSSDCSSSSDSSSEESDSEGQITVIPNLKIVDMKIKMHEQIQENNDGIRIWRDSISLQSEEKAAEPPVKPEEIIIEFDDDRSPVKPQKIETVNVKTDDNKNDNITVPKMKKIQQLSKDSRPIFDNSKDFCGDKVNLDIQPRTPLGNRSNNPKLSLSSKSPQQLLRNKCLSAKTQQENTPPRVRNSKSKNKTNGTQWDLDRTVII